MLNASTMDPIAVDDTGIYTMTIAYDVSNNPIYVGKAEVGSLKSQPKWQIKKLTYDVSNNPTDIQWASQGAFNQIWDNRTSLSYE